MTPTAADPGPVPLAPAVGLLRDLVRHPNATPDEIQAFILRGITPRLEGARLDVLCRDPMGNLIALRHGADAALPPLVLLTYAADYPADGMNDPYTPHLLDGAAFGEAGPCVWGRGNCEHRGALAAALDAFVEVVNAEQGPRRSLMFVTLVSGESGTHAAAAHVFEQAGFRTGPTIVARNTSNQVGLGNKGSMSLELHVTGRVAHSSDPGAGRNAIEAAYALLGALQEDARRVPPDPHLGAVALVPTNVSSEPMGVHAIPRACHVFMMRRVIPSEDPEAVYGRLAKICADEGAALDLHGFQYAATLPAEAWLGCLVAGALRAATGAAPTCFLAQSLDAGYFRRRGLEALCFGPGSARLAHTATDVVSVAELITARDVYARVLRAAAKADDL